MILNSPHFSLCGVGRHPAGLVCTHARKYTRDMSRQASVATWRARIMTPIMSAYGEGEEERERVGDEESEGERALLFPFQESYCRLPCGSFQSPVPTHRLSNHKGWAAERTGGAIDTVKCSSRGRRFFGRNGGFVCCERSELQSIDLPRSPFLFIAFLPLSHRPD